MTEVNLLDLPDEVFEHIFVRAVDADDGCVPFASWYLGGVCRRFRYALDRHIRRVALATCVEHDHVVGRECAARAAACVLAGPLLRCRHLEHLDITSCDALSDAQVIRFLRAAPPLRRFTCVVCMRQTDALVCALATTSGGYLEQLDLSGCDRGRHTSALRRPRHRPPYRPCRALSDTSMYAIASNCSSLREISLCSAVGVSDSGLYALAGLHSLEVVQLHRLTEVTDAGVAALANGCGRIHKFHLLSLGTVSDIGVRAVAQGTATKPYLRSVAISFNYLVTDGAIRTLLESAPLEEMRCDHCAHLSEAWTIGLGNSYDRLHTVSLRGVSLDISSRGIRKLACASRLRELDLGFCSSITAKVLLNLRQCAPYLEKLILDACSKVDNVAAEQLAAFPRLNYLDVSLCSKLRDSGLLCIVRGGTGQRLAHLVLGPVNAGEDGRRNLLYELGTTCTKLETLVLRGEFDDDSLEWLRNNTTAAVDYSDVMFRSSKRRTSTASNSSGMSE